MTVTVRKITINVPMTTVPEDLKAEVESDGAAEAATYGEYACFCKETTATKSGSITKGQDTIVVML